MAHPAIAEAAVIAIPHEKWGERPLACIVFKPGQNAARRRRLSAHLLAPRLRQVAAARPLRGDRRHPAHLDRQVLEAEAARALSALMPSTVHSDDFPDHCQNRLSSTPRRRRRRRRLAGRLRRARLPRVRAVASSRAARCPTSATARSRCSAASSTRWRAWAWASRRRAGAEAGEERARRRRRARPLPPAQRPGGLRRAGAHGAGLLAALSADRRPGQLRRARRRRRRGDALHRGAAGADRAPAARRDRRGHGRLHRPTTTADRGAARCCRRACRSCCSTAPAASPSAWPPRSRATTCARSPPPRWR